AGEVLVHRALGHLGHLAELVHAGPADALLTEQLLGRADDALACSSTAALPLRALLRRGHGSIIDRFGSHSLYIGLAAFSVLGLGYVHRSVYLRPSSGNTRLHQRKGSIMDMLDGTTTVITEGNLDTTVRSGGASNTTGISGTSGSTGMDRHGGRR